jgi:hypothetical protein
MQLKRIGTAIATTGVLLIGGCSSATAVHEESISGRGGFQDPERRLAQAVDEDYCGAEVLRWRYDPPSATLKLSDARLLLSCCGQRAMSVERFDRIYEITERDEPDGVLGRCEDRCTFDFSVGVQEVPQGEVYVRLLRDVVDEQGSASVVWSGSLDLTRGAGAVVLDAVASAPTCQERALPGRRSTTLASK